MTSATSETYIPDNMSRSIERHKVIDVQLTQEFASYERGYYFEQTSKLNYTCCYAPKDLDTFVQNGNIFLRLDFLPTMPLTVDFFSEKTSECFHCFASVKVVYNSTEKPTFSPNIRFKNVCLPKGTCQVYAQISSPINRVKDIQMIWNTANFVYTPLAGDSDSAISLFVKWNEPGVLSCWKERNLRT